MEPMKSLFIPYLEDLNKVNLEDADKIIENHGSSTIIDTLNWANEYPYKPLTNIYVARSDDAFFIKYSVKGGTLKAIYSTDQSKVHEDSCVEFFCMPEGTEKYTNFEFNCIGTCSASSRKGRSKDVIPFSEQEMKTIKRFSSVGSNTFNEIEGEHEWKLIVKIPMKLMAIDPKNLPSKIRGNFYKCADKTQSPHFVSWSPIKTEQPDFHRPEFFGILFLK